MQAKTKTPYGEWPSTLSPQRLTEGALRLSEVALQGTRVVWIEGRAEEGGRAVIVAADEHGAAVDLLPPPYSARSRVHEYGGGAMAVHGQEIWFCNDADQRIYALGHDGDCAAVTPEGPWRYADLVYDPARRRLLCVREDHSAQGEPVNALVTVDLGRRAGRGRVEVLVEGADFYASPRLSHDGGWLAYLSWVHPDMPWDATTLWLARLDGSGRGPSPTAVAGGGEESIAQPQFARDGALYFVSDRSGWWNLHVLRDGHISCVLSERAEFAMPHWQFGMNCFGLTGGGDVVSTSSPARAGPCPTPSAR
jgi:hypothetical protein